MADYCTGWPDGNWGQCCKVHDEFYATNADNLNWFDFVGSHWELASCVGGTMGATMFAGLCTVGLLFWVVLKNKFKPGSRPEKGR